MQHRLLVEFLQRLDEQFGDDSSFEPDSLYIDTKAADFKVGRVRKKGNMKAVAHSNSTAVNAEKGATVQINIGVPNKE